MNTIIPPAVGRVVWYWPTAYDLAQGMFAYPGSDQPMAATVSFVHSNRMVNLSVVDHNGQAFEKRSTTLLQDGDVVRDRAGYAEWMPYQKGQAAANLQPAGSEPAKPDALTTLLQSAFGSAATRQAVEGGVGEVGYRLCECGLPLEQCQELSGLGQDGGVNPAEPEQVFVGTYAQLIDAAQCLAHTAVAIGQIQTKKARKLQARLLSQVDNILDAFPAT